MLKMKVLERINLQKHKKTSTDAAHTLKTNSAGPIRLVVSEDDLVARVIDTAFNSHACEGPLLVLGSNVKDFLLQSRGKCSIAERKAEITAPKGSVSSWKAWLNKSFTFKISSSH
ncbi:hypothetical protein D8674_034685 [Pyrus ussuriensis x Pyrus communis]|uniref:DUF7054 domain-containing protein n=1 Tax=Pyrus ussuriensis x Pyrus communis TaxID=2448454 RepID=A0A5N5GA96_9ROSA|nr:hypothetical protein D8674_034685 [Pyrus ussuriensis x Pyrus communis]